MWILLTVFALALAQQPKVRRTLQKEIADYQANRSPRRGRRTSGRDISAGDRRGETAHLSLRPSAR